MSLSYECGGCTVCCELLKVDDEAANFHKPVMVPCKHLCKEGCSIYTAPDKPKICGDYYCMYRINPGNLFAENDRPDKLGLLVVMNDVESPFTKKTSMPTFTIYETRPDGFNGYWPEKLIKRLEKKWLIVLMPWSQRKTEYKMDESIRWIGPAKWIALLNKFTGGRHG